MGSSSSRPSTAYPFPMPLTGYDPPFSKSNKWPLSSVKKSKRDKDREKYDDFIVSKFPTTTAPYGIPYYPQMPSTYPAYYAPVQMAVMQPIGVQPPVFGMPQAYLPMAAYQTTAAPVQPAIQSASAMRMPVPATTSAPQPVQASVVPPPSARTRMPQPQPVRDPPRTQAPVIPRTPVISNPVIPPPPIMHSEPPRAAPDSARLRFRDFYRPADALPPRWPDVDEPVRPPTAGPAGRTPFVSSMPMPSADEPVRPPTAGPSGRMPVPMPIPTSNNPLPPPPIDKWDSSPYRHYRRALESFPTSPSALLGLQPCTEVHVDMPEPEPAPRPSARLGGLFGSTSRKDKGKKPLKGVLRSRSTSGRDVQGDIRSSSGSRHGHGRSHTMTSILIPAPVNMPQPGVPNTSMPVPAHGPPIRFDHTGAYAGFVNDSNHRVMYKERTYPTALHLLEAMKFTHLPVLQERIRTCKDVNDMYPLSASLQQHVRSDWGQVFLKTMEDVLYLKMRQHPSLRKLLLSTGLVDIIYADENTYWGEGPTGEGTNELGKALARVRERLRQEGG